MTVPAQDERVDNTDVGDEGFAYQGRRAGMIFLKKADLAQPEANKHERT